MRSTISFPLFWSGNQALKANVTIAAITLGLAIVQDFVQHAINGGIVTAIWQKVRNIAMDPTGGVRTAADTIRKLRNQYRGVGIPQTGANRVLMEHHNGRAISNGNSQVNNTRHMSRRRDRNSLGSHGAGMKNKGVRETNAGDIHVDICVYVELLRQCYFSWFSSPLLVPCAMIWRHLFSFLKEPSCDWW